MVHCDKNASIIWWASEELPIPYVSPIDGKWHRYFVDFLVGIRESDGTEKVLMIEIKPYRQCSAPVVKVFEGKTDRRKKEYRTYIRSVRDWAINSAKWKAAEEYCKKQGWSFKIVTDKDLKA